MHIDVKFLPAGAKISAFCGEKRYGVYRKNTNAWDGNSYAERGKCYRVVRPLLMRSAVNVAA